jgi:14-3-3 protein epsilon
MTAAWTNAALTDELVPQKKGDAAFKVPDSPDDLIFMAKLAEQAERYDEMVICMRKVAKLNSELSTEARNLLSVAYKNVIGARRASWRIISSIESREEEKGTRENVAMIVMLRKQFEDELAAICKDLLNLLDEFLIPAAQAGEPKVFYLKMKGDYHRYHAETIPSDSERNAALAAYQEAMKVANENLAPTNPIRLGLVLNFSVFHYEIMKNYEIGFNLARQAYDEAVPELESLPEEEYRESSLIVQLLRDNLNLWSGE